MEPQGRTVRRLAGELDVAAAAREAREMAVACGLSGVEAEHVATAVSEVARNALKYGTRGVVELAPDVRRGRRGLAVTVSDSGPGIADVEAALHDGFSTGGSLGLGLPGARRLMDDFAIESGPGGTVVAMGRWERGRLATSHPAVWWVHEGPGGHPVAQPFRNGLLLGLAAGPRAAEIARRWGTRPWRPPGELVQDGRAQLDAGERLGFALASVSALDGRLTWLRGGGVSCVLVRGAGALHPPAAAALGAASAGPPRTATVDVRRDDVLVMAAGVLDAPALGALAGGPPGGPASLTARFERGALEPRRPAGGVEGRSTLEGP